MPAKPRLAEVQCTKIRFEPGDRIIVRVYQPLDDAATKRLRQTVEKWAGGAVEVLVVDVTLFDVEHDKSKRQQIILPQ